MYEAEFALDEAVKQYAGGNYVRYGSHGGALDSGEIVRIGVEKMGDDGEYNLRVEYSGERIDAIPLRNFVPDCLPIGEGRGIIVLPNNGYIILTTKERMKVEAEERRSDSWIASLNPGGLSHLEPREPYDDMEHAARCRQGDEYPE